MKTKFLTHNFGIVVILVVFALLGVTGIFFNFGMAHSVGDESVLLTTVLKMIGNPQLTPADQYNYMMPVLPYIYLPFFIIMFVLLRISGVFTSFDELTAFGIVDYGYFLPVTRFVSVLAGLLSIYLLYLIGKRLFKSTGVALAASFFLASSLLFVIQSHVGKPWVPQIAAILFAFYWIVRLYEDKGSVFKHYVWIGITAAFALGVHAVGIFIYIPFLVVHWMKNTGKGLVKTFFINKYFWTTSGIVLASFPVWYALNPYGFLNYFGRAFVSVGALFGGVPEVDVAGTIATQFSFFEKFSFYGKVLWEYEPILLILSFASSFVLFVRQRNIFYILASFIVGYYLMIGPILGGSGLRFEPRFILPVVPFLALVAGYGLMWTWQRVRISATTKTFLLFVIFACTLYTPILWVYRVSGPNTTESAQKWVMQSIPEHSRIIVFDHAKEFLLNENDETLRDTKEFNPTFFTTKREFLLKRGSENYYTEPVYYVLTAPHYLEKEGIPEEILEKGFDYVIIEWWTPRERENVIEQTSFLGIRDVMPLKQFPASFKEKSLRVDLLGNMRDPLYYISNMTHTGPVIEIFKL